MSINPQSDLHGSKRIIFPSWNEETHYLERLTTSYSTAEEEAADYFEVHWSKIELTKIFMCWVEEIDRDSPEYDPALDNIEPPA